MEYKNFASQISFFEFIQDEFYEPDFDINSYKEEIEILKKEINVDFLTKLFEVKPRIFDIFEKIFQLSRFTNAQYIHFLFDVLALNSNEYGKILENAKKSIFKFENGLENTNFNSLFSRYNSSDDLTDIVLSIKRAVPNYVNLCLKKRNILYNHIENSIGSRYRTSKYLIENLRADDFNKAIDIKKYLAIKRNPKDTKQIHENFGSIKISQILKEFNIRDVSRFITSKVLSLNFNELPSDINNKLSYVREKAIDKIFIRKKKKLKKFDFIILHNGSPKFLIETNFYTTTGTKIGINVGEYTDLKEDIDKINQQNDLCLKFMWISDGNFWLTKEGENLFTNLKGNYFTEDFQLLNFNYLKLMLPKIIAKLEK